MGVSPYIPRAKAVGIANESDTKRFVGDYPVFNSKNQHQAIRDVKSSNGCIP
jgi:hypothetical protein